MNSNAVAGASHQSTSSTSSSSLSISDLLIQLENTPSRISGSQDLLSLFNLKPLYDTYVRPYPNPLDPKAPPPPPLPSIEGGGIKSGKILSIGFTMGGVRIGGGGVGGEGGDVEKDKGKRVKIEKSYAHLIEDIPGRNNIRKDTHLNRLVLNPDAQSFKVTPFDDTTLREAFTLQTGQIPGFDSLIWESEDPNAPKKKKKKRKHDHDSTNSVVGPGGLADEESRKKKKRKGSATSMQEEG